MGWEGELVWEILVRGSRAALCWTVQRNPCCRGGCPAARQLPPGPEAYMAPGPEAGGKSSSPR